MQKTLSLFLLLFVALGLRAASPLPIIPYPQSVEIKNGKCDAPAGFSVVNTDSAFAKDAAFLSDRLAAAGRLAVANRKGRRISFRLDPSITAPEGYKLDISGKEVTISSSRSAGAFYGVQTLLQLIDNCDKLPCVSISDAPRYAWRGYMRDDARHFTGVESVKQLLELMAYYKLNRFHWHLTDAQGWRIEIKKYPRLATVGGVGSHSDPDSPCAYYNQDEIRDIVKYAADRHIMIIPEIDMPGHATAANRAYPEYNGGGEGIFPDFTFNPGKEETYTFLSDILAEVAGLFPGPYIHIGGDEVAYGINAWKTDPHVLALMKREGFTDVRQCERYFMNRMISQVSHLGKTLIGWDELLDLDVDKSTGIMWWRHDKPGYLVRSLTAGYPTVLCPRKPLYFDFVQHDGHTVGRVWDGFCPLGDVYAFPDPWFDSIGVTPRQQSHILGLQANAWSELLHNSRRVDFMTWPRLCAVAESAWTQAAYKNFESFEARLDDAYRLFDKLGIYYFDHRDPAHHVEPAGPVIKKKSRESETDYRD